ncbi:MAG: hypothetical protein Q8R60_14145 [Mycobacteriales bacterium]|nr:hypothetical protein [Mycobacteriales bacterium]
MSASLDPTPVYDAMLADLVARAREGDAATGVLATAATLHEPGPGGTCRGCGLPTPCPTASLLDRSVDLDEARLEARRLLLARAVETAATGAAAPAVAPAALPAAGPQEPPGVGLDEDEERPTPVLPSAAELFAPNPGTARALDALLGGPTRR